MSDCNELNGQIVERSETAIKSVNILIAGKALKPKRKD